MFITVIIQRDPRIVVFDNEISKIRTLRIFFLLSEIQSTDTQLSKNSTQRVYLNKSEFLIVLCCLTFSIFLLLRSHGGRCSDSIRFPQSNSILGSLLNDHLYIGPLEILGDINPSQTDRTHKSNLSAPLQLNFCPQVNQ